MNFQLLKAVGRCMSVGSSAASATLPKRIMSAEYIMAGGRPSRSSSVSAASAPEKYTCNTLDLSAVPIIHEKTHLPVIVTPATPPASKTLAHDDRRCHAAGADGLM